MSHIEHLAGGALRVTAGAQPEPVAQPNHIEPAAQVHQGSYRSTAGGTAEHVGFARASISTAAPAQESGGSIMATLRNDAGPGGSTVDVGGLRTSLASAAALGFLVRLPSGQYVDVNSAASGIAAPASATSPVQQLQQSFEQQEQTSAPQPELASPDQEEAWAEDIEPLPQHAYEGALAGAASVVSTGNEEGWAHVANSLAESSGISREMAWEYVQGGFDFFKGQVNAALVSQGLGAEELEDFYEYLQTNRPDRLSSAINELTLARSTQLFRQFAGEWVRGGKKKAIR
ncbi:hypothetical protein [Eleftheria terrae]|uniref:hypothetical protein n=1 Tax=Eleftheria terrae TaxID=1597781 RepID=UPI00263BD0A8|nr:hypothetical protein [Eleftheria terrae]WKB55966.1 hypothetical protein N7L95_28250 [Eleftheria terrae]